MDKQKPEGDPAPEQELKTEAGQSEEPQLSKTPSASDTHPVTTPIEAQWEEVAKPDLPSERQSGINNEVSSPGKSITPYGAMGVIQELARQWEVTGDVANLRAAIRAGEQATATGEISAVALLNMAAQWQQHATASVDAEAEELIAALRTRTGISKSRPTASSIGGAVFSTDHTPAAPSSTAFSSQSDPAKYAARNLEKWLKEDDMEMLIEAYPYLLLSSHRKKIMEWAVTKAKSGDLRPLLTIGLEDTDAPVRNHVNKLLDSMPIDQLIPRLGAGAYSPKERRSIAGILGRCKAPEAGRLLAALASHEDGQVRESVMKALTHFPVTTGLQFPIFQKHLERDQDPAVRLEAARGLLRLGTEDAIKLVEKAQDSVPSTPQLSALYSQFQARRGRPIIVEPEPELEPEPPVEKKIPKGVKAKPAERSRFLVVGSLIAAVLACIIGVRELLHYMNKKPATKVIVVPKAAPPAPTPAWRP